MHAQSLKESCLKISHHLEKSIINERSVSQCRISSRVTVFPIKTPSEMAMPQCRVIPQLPIHHKPSEKTNWLCLSAKRHPTKKLSSMSGVCPNVNNVASENPSLIRGVWPSVNHHLNSPFIMLWEIISDQARVLPMCELLNTMWSNGLRVVFRHGT